MLICLTANHHNASFELLEKLSLVSPAIAPRLVESSDFVQGAVVLATCNRFEAYLDVDEPIIAGETLATEQAADFLAEASGVDASEIRSTLTMLSGDRVIEHLFSVSSGLESLVVGEDEIAGQVRRSLERAREEGTTSSQLEQLFQRASQTSRGVKTKTKLGGAGRSLVRLALDLAESRVTDWAATRVVLVGTGKYARVTLAALRDRGVTNIHVYSPSGRAVGFAHKHELEPVGEDQLIATLAQSDVVVTCSTAPSVVLTAGQLTQADALPASVERRLVIDLGLPRNVDPSVQQLASSELLDLETISLHAPLKELNAESDARALVGQASAEFVAARNEGDVKPAIVALRKHLFDALDAEIERSTGNSAENDSTERALRHLVGVLLHTPSVRARELARDGDSAKVFEAINTLFGIDVRAEAAAAAAASVPHIGEVAGGASGGTCPVTGVGAGLSHAADAETAARDLA